jgi:hypothetical protein
MTIHHSGGPERQGNSGDFGINLPEAKGWRWWTDASSRNAARRLIARRKAGWL